MSDTTGNLIGMGCLAFLVLCLFAVMGMAFPGRTDLALRRVEEGKLVAIYFSWKLPEPLREDYPHALEFRYYDLVKQEAFPADGSSGLLEATYDEMKRRESQEMVVAAPIYHAFKPTIPSAEDGTKVYLMLVGFTGVTERGVEVGNVVYSPDYNSTFQPFATDRNIWDIGNCFLRIYFGNGSFSEQECSVGGYYPISNFIRQSVTPEHSSSGLFGVYAYSLGTWIVPLDMATLGSALSNSSLPAGDQTAIQQLYNFLNRVPQIYVNP